MKVILDTVLKLANMSAIEWAPFHFKIARRFKICPKYLSKIFQIPKSISYQ